MASKAKMNTASKENAASKMSMLPIDDMKTVNRQLRKS
jgi:hypothetical protein